MKKLLVFSLLLLLLAGFFYTRLIYLDSGVHLTEPDEWSYDIASKSLNQSPIPKVGGRPLIEQAPIFEYAAFYLDKFFIKEKDHPKTFLSIRAVSVIASFLLAVSIFIYLRKKENLRTAFYAFTLFTITPIILFYSKVGLREMLLLLVVFWFFVSFEKISVSKHPVRSSIITGLLLGLAIAIKTTALIFTTIPILFLIISLFKKLRLENIAINRFRFSVDFTKSWQGLISNGIVLISGFILAASAFIPYLILFPRLLKDRFYLTFFAHNLEGTLEKIKTITYYFGHLEFWLSLPVIILILLGVGKIFLLRQSKWFLLILFMVPIGMFLLANEPRGRYFVLITPFLIILASQGLDYLINLFSKLKFLYPHLLIPLILFLLILPKTWLAQESTNHSVVEQAVKTVRENYQGGLVFSTFWPQIFQYSADLPTGRLTDRAIDLYRDHNELPEFSPQIDILPAEYVIKHNAFVLVHKPLDSNEFEERKRAVKIIENLYKPFKVVADNKPNFPEGAFNYSIDIYKFDKH